MLRDRHPDTGLTRELSDVVLVDDRYSQDVRWHPGQRLEHLFEERCDDLHDVGRFGHLAVDVADAALTYSELDARANRLARYLRDLGVGAGERVALLLDDAVHGYVGMLAVLKSGAAYVPLDVEFPADRIAYIVSDAAVSVVLSLEHLRSRLDGVNVEVVCVDAVAAEIDAQDGSRLPVDTGFVDGPAFISYPSVSTGDPTGVAVSHSSIYNFVRVAGAVYGYRPDDRVYQGSAMAVDFSVQEIWVPWMVGATLVPAPTGSRPTGADLRGFLIRRRITAMCCMPTLLATIDDAVPTLRFLLVSGEACPPALIVRWSQPGRRFLNVYGPTETTVAATWTVVDPDRRKTIGVPLPTYATVILDPEDPGRALGRGEVGEIGIAGIGLTTGYVNRDDLTDERFVPDFLAIPHNPSGRIYRTGDLGRVTVEGEIEHRGRIERQVKAEPAPSGYVAPSSPAERQLAELFAEILGLERVSVDSHFFDDLGANSLVLAKFCARVRSKTDLPPISIRDAYLRPTIAAIAAALPSATPDAPPAPVQPVPVVATRVSTPRYLLCGALQFVAFIASLYLGAALLETGFLWVSQATEWRGAYLRSLAYGAVVFFGMCLLPVLAKWVLIGRWKATEFPIWSLRYFRFWLVRLIIRANPMALFSGSPLYVLWLRALGAKIGPGVTIFSKSVPVCTDLLTIGAGTVIRGSAVLPGYRAEAGMIEIGPVTIGEDVLVGEKTVLEIGSSIGDGAQIGHCSSLQPGRHVPAGETWHGSPAQPTDVDYRVVAPARCGTGRRFWFSFLQLFNVLLIGPVGLAIVVELVSIIPWTAELLDVGHAGVTDWLFYLEVLGISLVVFYGGSLVGLVAVVTLPRLVNRLVVPGKAHALYGYHYYIHRLVRRMTNIQFFHGVFGDSSYIVNYLTAVGYSFPRVQQTGSNFGNQLAHDSPFLTTIGSGTMVSDGLTVMNADYSSTSFQVAPVALGERNFLGNNIFYPAGAKVGENVLLATKAMIPIDGPVRRDVGLLGSPCFEIPRTVLRDSDLHKNPEELAQGLAGKNRYNRRTIGILLQVRWFQTFLLLLVATAAGDLYHTLGTWAVAAAFLLILALGTGYGILVERLSTRFRDLQPRTCSIYDPYFWWHERHWKLLSPALFSGTPFRPLILRLLGVKIGRRVFDNGCAIPEKTLVTIGDDATLNEGVVIQCHSMEDGAFKSDRTVIGARVTLGIQAFVHYGVTMAPDSVLEADSFLMKGGAVGAGERWRGNPAVETDEGAPRPVPAAIPALSIPEPSPVPAREVIPALSIPEPSPVPAREVIPVPSASPAVPAPAQPRLRPRLLPVGVAVAVSMALSLSIAVTVAMAGQSVQIGQPAAVPPPALPDPIPAQPVPAAAPVQQVEPQQAPLEPAVLEAPAAAQESVQPRRDNPPAEVPAPRARVETPPAPPAVRRPAPAPPAPAPAPTPTAEGAPDPTAAPTTRPSTSRPTTTRPSTSRPSAPRPAPSRPTSSPAPSSSPPSSTSTRPPRRTGEQSSGAPRTSPGRPSATTSRRE
ncbi:Pls/PosA family non-ribosomal peptide synthetase [Pseudonocardia xinjiangensis]|uniref:Pls/PosA family non-ribosomal peptide synthetase n=1 Tax=Pseudonocardia xinjiangensis TaxID=75289 RepID=UPI0028AF9000|nr:Pls/PosA family non-ribosomal peptide synthetase [Pseudonocardia xinjiangensis]